MGKQQLSNSFNIFNISRIFINPSQNLTTSRRLLDPSNRSLHDGNKGLFKNPDNKFSKLVGFYHVALINDWRTVLFSQLGHLNSSGLLEQSNAVHITLLGNETSEVRVALHHLNTSRNLLSYNFKDLRLWEYPTLERLHAHCQENVHDFVYYFHSKGVSKPFGSKAFRREQEWRQVMEHFIFDNWRVCLSLMQHNTSKWACGARLLERPL